MKPEPVPATILRRFHGTVELGRYLVGRDASDSADEVITHLVGLGNTTAGVTLKLEPKMPAGAPEHVVRIVTENSRALRFTGQGFEEERSQSESIDWRCCPEWIIGRGRHM